MVEGQKPSSLCIASYVDTTLSLVLDYFQSYREASRPSRQPQARQTLALRRLLRQGFGLTSPTIGCIDTDRRSPLLPSRRPIFTVDVRWR
jgi:hypothetical protein